MVLELVEAVAPHLAIGLEPLVELDEWFRAQAVEATLAIRADRNQSGIAHYAKVFGYRGLTDAQLSRGGGERAPPREGGERTQPRLEIHNLALYGCGPLCISVLSAA